CREARKHASELCNKNGETYNINADSGYCKLAKTGQLNSKTIYFVNLVFSCQNKPTIATDGPGARQ
ncbi:MAG: hypothetical protein PVF81_08605, partial [Thioalkalispiraceae bacterium]